MLWNSLVVIGFMAAVVLVVSVYGEAARVSRRARWHRAQATVTHQESVRATTGPPSWTPFLARQAVARYTDGEGREHTLKVPDRALDSLVPILISPVRPHRAVVDFGPHRVVCLVTFVITAACCLLLALIPHPH